MTMMLLIDKSYYDYDYERIVRRRTFEETVKSDDKILALMQKFGIGVKKDSAEELQKMARRDLIKDV